MERRGAGKESRGAGRSKKEGEESRGEESDREERGGGEDREEKCRASSISVYSDITFLLGSPIDTALCFIVYAVCAPRLVYSQGF